MEKSLPVKLLITGLVYFAASRFSFLASSLTGEVSVIWFACGFALAFVLRWGLSVWPAIFIADLCSGLMNAPFFFTFCVTAAGNTLSILTAALLIFRFSDRDNLLGSASNAGCFLLASVALGLISVGVGIPAIYLNGGISLDEIFLTSWAWFLSDTVGSLLVTPAVLLFFNGISVPSSKRLCELLIILSLVLGICYLFFWVDYSNELMAYFLAFAFYPTMIWATWRVSRFGLQLVAWTAAIGACLGIARGHGAFSQFELAEALVIFQTLYAITLASCVLLRSLLNEKKSMIYKLEHRVKRRTSHLENTLKQLQKAESSYRRIFENAREGIIQLDPQGNVVRINSAACRMLTVDPPEQLLASGPVSVQNLTQEPDQLELILSRLKSQKELHREEVRIERDSVRWVSISAGMQEDGSMDGILVDITEQKLKEQELEDRVTREPLTGLFNRVGLGIQINQLVVEGKPFSVVFLDLDGFKLVNDRLGHALGDSLLIEISRVIQFCIRGSDIIARVGGDEFILLIPGLTKAALIQEKVQQIIAAISEITSIDAAVVEIGASAGISRFPKDSDKVGLLIDYADSAMYLAKKAGKGTCRIYGKEAALDAANLDEALAS